MVLLSCNLGSPHAYSIVHNGHAHNDYEHERPLFDALRYGFRSIEVDVHAWDRQLWVAHDSTDFRELPDIVSLYIDPLDSLYTHDHLQSIPGSLILLVDLKTEKESALRLLDVLTNERDHLFYNGNNQGPIQLVVSGNPPLDIFEELDNSYLFIDGRFDHQYPTSLEKSIPWISGDFQALFGDMEGEARSLSIKNRILEAHDQNRKVRFWKTHDAPQAWQELSDLGVDWIGVDDLAGFYTWSLARK